MLPDSLKFVSFFVSHTWPTDLVLLPTRAWLVLARTGAMTPHSFFTAGLVAIDADEALTLWVQEKMPSSRPDTIERPCACCHASSPSPDHNVQPHTVPWRSPCLSPPSEHGHLMPFTPPHANTRASRSYGVSRPTPDTQHIVAIDSRSQVLSVRPLEVRCALCMGPMLPGVDMHGICKCIT